MALKMTHELYNDRKLRATGKRPEPSSHSLAMQTTKTIVYRMLYNLSVTDEDEVQTVGSTTDFARGLLADDRNVNPITGIII